MMELQLEKYSVQKERWPKEAKHEIENVSAFVCEQRALVEAHQLDQLILPAECVYSVSEAVQKTLYMF